MIADLTGKTALVTGGGQGIGPGIAMSLAEQGADVAITYRSSDGQAIVDQIEALGRKSMALQLDITDSGRAGEVVGDVISQWGELDILVNNLGISGAPGATGQGNVRDIDWELTWKINIKGLADVTEGALPHFRERKSGKIVNISSVAARWPRYAIAYYVTTKSGVISYTQAVAKEMAPYNVNVNCICPGRVWTRFHQEWFENREAAGDTAVVGNVHYDLFVAGVKEAIPLGREQTPEDIGKLAAFLSSDDAKNITGQSIQVDGGQVMV